MKLFFEAELNILGWTKKDTFPDYDYFFVLPTIFFFLNLDLTKTKIQFSKNIYSC